MKLFVTKMKRNINDIIQRPKLLDLIMEKRIIHLVQVTQILFFVHVLSKNVSMTTFFEIVDKVFIVSLFWCSWAVGHCAVKFEGPSF